MVDFFMFMLIITVDHSNEFFLSDRYSELLNFRFITFDEKYFLLFKVWLIISHRFVLGFYT